MSTNVETQRDVKKMGYLKKHKTMKKKLFVLREESENGPARLEYYDNEKKFVCGRPKRSIHLHNCFSINAKADSKHKYVIVLYTREDCFTVICENEADHREWLSAMISLRNYHTHGNTAIPLYEHIWSVTVKPKGLGNSKYLSAGQYRLCLMPNEVSFIRQNKDTPDLVLQLASIRKCGHTECFFYLEPGRMAVTGSGMLWMQVEDALIAQNMHEAILSFMTASSVSADQPPFRSRRHTITEKVKPTNLPVKQHSQPHTTSAVSVTRSKTMSAADQPARWRVSHSPSKSTGGAGTLHSTTATDLGTCTHNLSMFSDTSHRSRTDSTDSSFSRNTNSFSADEIDSPTEELCHGSSTPTGPSDHLVHGEHCPLDFGLSNQASSHEEANYFDMDSVSRLTKLDHYMEMDTARGHTDVEKVGSTSSTVRPSRDSSSHDKDHYVDMALPVNVEDVNIVSDEGSVDSGVRLDCSGTAVKTRASGSATLSQDRPDVDEYILMNAGTGTLEDSSYMDMSQNSSIAASPALSTSSSLHDVPTNSHYISMSCGSRSNSVTDQDEYFEVGQDSLGYMAMSHTGSSPRLSHSLRPDRVCSYLADENTEQMPLRSSSLGSRSQLLQSKSLTESYLDMQKGQEVTNSGDRASSTPMLSRTLSQKGQRNRSHGGQAGSFKHSSKESLEEKDFLMEMNFNHKSRHSKEHEYEEVRPRSSSGGSHDFRNRTLSSGSQERRRTGSFGYREKLSKIASLARANIQEQKKSENNHGQRHRMTTVCQDSFHKRTNSFGATISDMRPRSSSHGNARYMDMSGHSRINCSHASSHDCLHCLNKRGSQDSVISGSSDYLDMRPRVSTLPSQALVSMFKSKDHSRYSPRSPLVTDSDYLSMEHGRSSGDSSTEYASMDLNSQKSSEDHYHHQSGKAQMKRGSTYSKVSFSSSESLTSNTSQSSDGRSADRQRTTASSPITDNTGHGIKSKRPSRSCEKELKPGGPRLDDSYVLYSPANSREPSPLPGSCSASLEKVSSPIHAEGNTTVTSFISASSKADMKHEYVNVDYDHKKEIAIGAKVSGPSSNSSGSGHMLPSVAINGLSTSADFPEAHSETSHTEASDSGVMLMMRMNRHHSDQAELSSPSQTAATESKVQSGDDSSKTSVRNTELVTAKTSNDNKTDKDNTESPSLPTVEPDYLVIKPGSVHAKPTTPAPFPSLDLVVSPITDENQPEKSFPVNMPPLPSRTEDDYIEINKAENVPVSVEQGTTASTSMSSTGDRTSSTQTGSGAESMQLIKQTPAAAAAAAATEVNYATLDLQAVGDDQTHSKPASSSSSAGSESPDEVPLQYAQIDFKKSEELRKSNAEKKTPAPFDL